MVSLREPAPAKVNLTLRVLGRRPDGYHQITSLVAFADFGDVVTLEPERPTGFVIEGPFAAKIVGVNLIERAIAAARAVATEGGGEDLAVGAVRLVKRLPVAAGLGGGSSDAGAVLRALAQANPAPATEIDWAAIAGSLGADVPVCWRGHAALISGIGERVHPVNGLAPLDAVLVNPGIELSTPAVFAALAAPDFETPGPEPDLAVALETRSNLFAFMCRQGNDLEPVAIRLAPVVGEVLDILSRSAGCQLARMSGSGATCFGIFGDHEEANRTARRLQTEHPGWWIRACLLA